MGNQDSKQMQQRMIQINKHVSSIFARSSLILTTSHSTQEGIMSMYRRYNKNSSPLLDTSVDKYGDLHISNAVYLQLL